MDDIMDILTGKKEITLQSGISTMIPPPPTFFFFFWKATAVSFDGILTT